MKDSFGDTWNGNYLQFYKIVDGQTDENPTYQITLTEESVKEKEIQLNISYGIYDVSLGGGSYTNEVSFEVQPDFFSGSQSATEYQYNDINEFSRALLEI